MFIQLLHQKFPSDSNNIIKKEQANTKLLTLLQKKDDNLYIYYCQTKILFIGIFKKN